MCTCSKWKYPENCSRMCCGGGNIDATPDACMVSGKSVTYSHMSCNQTVKPVSCGDVSECACKGE